MPVPGDTLLKRISLIDSVGTGIPGATFTVTARDPNGMVVTPLPPTDLGDGIYEFTLATSLIDPEGTYYLQAISATTPPQVFELEWLVKPHGTPARWRPGDVLMDYITVIDSNNQPVLGDTFAITALDTTARPMTVPAVTEVGNGIYRVALRSSRFDPPGLYYIRLTSSLHPAQTYEVEFVTGQPVNLIGGTTRRDLRRAIMAKFGDLVRCKATSDGSTTVFIDEDNLVGEPGRYAGREIMFVTGMNAGQTRYVDGSSRETSAVILRRPLPYMTMNGDEADITNAYGIGITFQAVDNAINYAIGIARDRAMVPVSYRLTDWNGTDSIPIPFEAVGIRGVYSIDTDGRQHHIRRGRSRGNGWMVDRANRCLFIHGYEGRQVSGHDLVIEANALPNLLTDDDDVTMLPFQFLVSAATAHLCLDTLLSRQAPGEWGSKGMLYKQEAESLITTLTPNLGTDYTAV